MPIVIPVIQRNYAQGRETALSIRNNFLIALYESLTKDIHINLDFVYGSTEDGKFYPLDGQQRLTTLFLLHWYLAKKQNSQNANLRILENFTYETRTSSTEFCKALVNSDLNLLNLLQNTGEFSNSLSLTIKDSPWYFLSWDKDPNIKSMLHMLDAIHEKFRYAPPLLEKLMSAQPLVTFDFIELTNYGLADDLYIKMNARGKVLNEFEHFKAKFEQFLSKGVHTEQVQQKKRFSESIDNMWTDLFWLYRTDHQIDTIFLRYIYYVTEILYHKKRSSYQFTLVYTNNQPLISFDIIQEIFHDQNNLSFLFDSLDLLSKLIKPEDWFYKLFKNKDYVEGAVDLFDSEVDLFKACIYSSGFGIKEKLLLYATIQYQLQSKEEQITESYNDYLRVVRNLILKTRQRDNTVFNANLRVEAIEKYLQDIDMLITAPEDVYVTLSQGVKLYGFTNELISTEVDKARFIVLHPELKSIIHTMEDINVLKGFIHNLDIENNIDKLVDFAAAIEEIWNIDNHKLIIRALLTITKDYATALGYSSLGHKYFMGDNSKWHTILTAHDGRISRLIPTFLKKYLDTEGYTPDERLQQMVNYWLMQPQKYSWAYYVVKYPEMLSNTNNIFTFKTNNTNYEVTNISGNSVRAYHINPYIRTVIDKINNQSICTIGDCVGKDRVEGALSLKNGLVLLCKEEGWQVTSNKFTLDHQLAKSLGLHIKSDLYWLKEGQMLDRIEVAIEFATKTAVFNHLDLNFFEKTPE